MRIDSENRYEDHQDSNWIGQLLSIRAALGIGAVLLITLNTIYGFALPNTNVECIVDYTFLASAIINSYFSIYPFNKNLLLIFSSLSVDLIMISLGFLWILNGKSWRVIFSLSIFYSFKFIIQLIFQEKTPEGFLWDYPGVPSIMISYLRTETFFYSTIMGFLTIAALEFWKLKNKYLSILTIIIGTLQFFIRNVLRGNYIIDILAAIILAHFIFIFSDEYCRDYIDNSKYEWLKLVDKDLDSSVSTSNDAIYNNKNDI